MMVGPDRYPRAVLGRRAVLGLPFLTLASRVQAQEPRDVLRAGIAALNRAASHRNLTGSWERPGVPVRAILRSPAGEESVAAAEAKIGRTLPAGLRAFFRDVTAGLDVNWVLPGRTYVAPSGIVLVRYAVIPPPPFATPGPPPSPVINAGGLRVVLGDLPAMVGEWRMWRDMRRASEQEATDPAERAHHRYHAKIWDRGYPFARTMGGDIVAVDTHDPAERLLLLRHDGDDAPAYLLGQDLATHLSHQARLAFPGFEIDRLELFADEARGQAAADAFASSISEAGRDDSLVPPWTCVVDAEGANAGAWRKWLGA